MSRPKPPFALINYYRRKAVEHKHCFHLFRGPIHMVIPDGHVVQKCCTCERTRTVHADHAYDRHALV